MRLQIVLMCAPFLLLATLRPAGQETGDIALKQALVAHALPLAAGGEAILLKEADQHDYFLLGELHGETEIPRLLAALWPRLWESKYRHVAAEASRFFVATLQKERR